MPFLAMIYIIRDEKDIVLMLKIICFCALFNSALGVVEFYFKHRFLVDVFPKSMLAVHAESNPTLAVLTVDPLHGGVRNGIFRATSTFLVPLSFGEFEIIVIPIALFFAMHRQDLFERCLGWTVVDQRNRRNTRFRLTRRLCRFSRLDGGVRRHLVNSQGAHPQDEPGAGGRRHHGRDLVRYRVRADSFWPRAHNMVLGGGAEQASTEGRWVQWRAALPLIESNPITGHGFVTGGFDIGSSIDSYVISLLVETGIPGLVFFAGIVCLPIWYGVRAYLTDLSESGALAGLTRLQLHRLHSLQARSVGTGKPLSDILPAGYRRCSELRVSNETRQRTTKFKSATENVFAPWGTRARDSVTAVSVVSAPFNLEWTGD